MAEGEALGFPHLARAQERHQGAGVEPVLRQLAILLDHLPHRLDPLLVIPLRGDLPAAGVLLAPLAGAAGGAVDEQQVAAFAGALAAFLIWRARSYSDSRRWISTRSWRRNGS